MLWPFRGHASKSLVTRSALSFTSFEIQRSRDLALQKLRGSDILSLVVVDNAQTNDNTGVAIVEAATSCCQCVVFEQKSVGEIMDRTCEVSAFVSITAIVSNARGGRQDYTNAFDRIWNMGFWWPKHACLR